MIKVWVLIDKGLFNEDNELKMIFTTREKAFEYFGEKCLARFWNNDCSKYEWDNMTAGEKLNYMIDHHFVLTTSYLDMD